MKYLLFAVSLFTIWLAPHFQVNAAKPPNVLLITIDDLNDWVGCLGGHPQSRTPHIDALAKRGVLFTNAHCNAPICNPSRVSFMTGIRPSTSGIYLNHHALRGRKSAIRDAVTLPQLFARHGYLTMGCGKLFHGSGGKSEFEVYGPAGGQGPLPKRPLNCPVEQSRSKLWDWGVFPEVEGESYYDIADARWVGERLREDRDTPFFLGCGFYRPHVPLYAPQRYFDLHPLQRVKLPLVQPHDRQDIPPYALRLTENPTPPRHEWFVRSGEWPHAVQSYLACVSFTDDNVGRVIAALDAGPHADDTWIVLLSDHGFFLGEKERWAKQSLWERATKVPLIIVPPRRQTGKFAQPGSGCHRSVELLSLFPTLLDVCGLPALEEQCQGQSLRALLRKPDAEWPYVAITTHAGNNHAVRDDRYRYIRYADGSQELYDLQVDPHEWTNLATSAELQPVINRLRQAVPTKVREPMSSPSAR